MLAPMEGAQLRPVPARPPGPVDPGEAARHVREVLPALPETAARALGLAALAGQSREDIAGQLEVATEDLGDLLARGRKALRRSMFPLPGSGWCERAERLISDRMDGELHAPGPARLEVHLRNCVRCVEHERRLAQATDALVATFVDSHPVPVPERETGPEPAEPAPLRVVEPAAAARPEPARQEEPPVPAALETPSQRLTLGALAWNALFMLAVLLAIATVVIAVLGILGGQL
jgi:hypothetical protein